MASLLILRGVFFLAESQYVCPARAHLTASFKHLDREIYWTTDLKKNIH